MASLFASPDDARALTPLAERMRPRTLSEVAGQAEAVSVLRELTQRRALPSLILWGPPGCGKTTIARLLAGERYEFVPMSAVLAGVKDVREALEGARRRRELDGRGTLLFLDEIHRFNKAQQDILLPHVEAGTIVLVGATTENPSFEVIGPLLSRCRVLVLTALSVEDIEALLWRALGDPERGLAPSADEPFPAEPEAVRMIAALAAGDARFALNTLEVCAGLVGRGDVVGAAILPPLENADGLEGGINATPTGSIDTAVLKRALAGRALLYDKGGDEHFNAISALHKALRGSDPDAALYWMARMLEGGEDPKYVVRRLIRFASEDIGLADPWALAHAIAAKDSVEFLGMPECNTALAQLCVYLACAPKSNAMYTAYASAREAVARHGALPVPLHIRNAPTGLMKDLGYGKDYKYAHDFPDGFVPDNYWPDALKDDPPRLLKLTGRGSEKALLERLRAWWGERFGSASLPLASDPVARASTLASEPVARASSLASDSAGVSPASFPKQHPDEGLRIRQRNLPHWEIGGHAYFVTWRLAEGQPELSPAERDLVVSALRHFNGDRYELYAFVVMNDHVHVVFRPLGEQPLGKILHSWKSFTAHEINRSGRSGSIWLHDSYDRIIRDEAEFVEKCEYVLTNPRRRWPDLREYQWAGSR